MFYQALGKFKKLGSITQESIDHNGFEIGSDNGLMTCTMSYAQ